MAPMGKGPEELLARLGAGGGSPVAVAIIIRKRQVTHPRGQFLARTHLGATPAPRSKFGCVPRAERRSLRPPEVVGTAMIRWQGDDGDKRKRLFRQFRRNDESCRVAGRSYHSEPL